MLPGNVPRRGALENIDRISASSGAQKSPNLYITFYESRVLSPLRSHFCLPSFSFSFTRRPRFSRFKCLKPGKSYVFSLPS